MLAAITSYYNPSHRRVRYDNFIKFRENLKIPVYVIEAAFGDDPFELSSDFQVRCRDLMWQQYTLLNLAISHLPDKYDKVVWVDCDLLFDDFDWFEKMEDMLTRYKVVQNYSKIQMLDWKGDVYRERNGFVSKNIGHDNFSTRNQSGFSWGIDRDLAETHRLYDYWINGSSDRAMAMALFGVVDHEYFDVRLTDVMKRHYLEWAVPFHRAVDGKFSFIDQTIFHLWHGERNYLKRWNCFLDFDPYCDVGLSNEGVLEWKTDKPCMHECCRKMCLYYDLEIKHQ